MLNLSQFLFLLMAIVNQLTSARILGNQSPHRHGTHHSITIFMQDVLDGGAGSSPTPATTKVNGQFPFQKPLGLFPPNGGIPLPEGLSPQTVLDTSHGDLSFPAVATLQELEFGMVTTIEEDLATENPVHGSAIVGQAHGVYVASSDDGSSHMMAMTAVFGNGDRINDSLRFFGVHRTDISESIIAIIGGTGKYHDANGYATVESVIMGSNVDDHGSNGSRKLLLFKIYLSY